VTQAVAGPAFAPLRVPAYLRLWLGTSVVFLGVMAQAVARGWLAFDLTGSNAALGGVLFAFGVTLLVVTPVAGMVGDRFAKRGVLTASVGLLAATSAWIGLAVAWGVVAYWMLVTASALQGVAFGLYSPARMAFVTSLVPERQVPDAVALMMVNVEASRVAGPAAAGVAIGAAAWGLQGVFLACAVLFVLGLLAGLRLPHGLPERGHAAATPWGDIVDGIRYVRGSRDLSLLLWCVVAVSSVALPHLALLPAVSNDLFDQGSAGYGALSAVSAVGAVAAGLLVNRIRRRVGAWALVVMSGGTLAGSLAALGVAPSFYLALAVAVPLGAGMLVFQTATQALLMQRSEQRFHARVQSLVMLSVAGYGLVALPLGMVADLVGVRSTLAGMGLVVLLVISVFWVRSRSRGLWTEEPAELSAEVATHVTEERIVA